MDLNKELTTKFQLVNKAYFEKEAGIQYLRVEVNLRSLEEIAKLSKKINEYLDINDPTEADYYLDIFSPGTDESFNPIDSKEFIGKHVQMRLKKHIKDKDEYIGELLSADENELVVKWNAKGQFRKQPIAIDNIENIKIYIKVKK